MTEDSTYEVRDMVYDLVNKYVSRKTFFSIEEIIDYTYEKLESNPKITRDIVEIVLKSLIEENQIIPGTKLAKTNILNHRIRNKIYNYVKNNPGTDAIEIARILNIGKSQALGQLRLLKNFQLIRSIKIDSQIAYFKFELNSRYDEILYYFRNEDVKKIIKLIERVESSIEPKTISRLLKMNILIVKGYLDVLDGLNLINTLIDETESYFLNHENYQDVLEIIKRYS